MRDICQAALLGVSFPLWTRWLDSLTAFQLVGLAQTEGGPHQEFLPCHRIDSCARSLIELARLLLKFNCGGHVCCCCQAKADMHSWLGCARGSVEHDKLISAIATGLALEISQLLARLVRFNPSEPHGSATPSACRMHNVVRKSVLISVAHGEPHCLSGGSASPTLTPTKPVN